MPTKHIDELFQDSRYDLDNCLDKPVDWFESERQTLEKEYGFQISSTGVTMYAEQASGSNGLTETIVPGEFCLFRHEPIEKWTLPYYDRYPLAFVFEAGRDWFRGLNFHYLPYPLRIQLLEYLMKYATIKPVNNKTRILLDWDEAKNSWSGHLIMPIEQKYWMGEVRSAFKLIEPRHWALMTMLPCERFGLEEKSRVWANKMEHSAEVVKDYVAKHGTPEHVRMVRDRFNSMVQGPSISITRTLEEV